MHLRSEPVCIFGLVSGPSPGRDLPRIFEAARMAFAARPKRLSDTAEHADLLQLHTVQLLAEVQVDQYFG